MISVPEHMKGHPSVGGCHDCDRDTFLRPVHVFPGMAGPDVMLVLWLCLDCRISTQDGKYQVLVTSFLHHPAPIARAVARAALAKMAPQVSP